MGCSVTKSTRVASVNNNSVTKHLAVQQPDQGAGDWSRRSSRQRLNGGSHKSSMAECSSPRKKRTSPGAKVSARWSFRRDLLHRGDTGDDKVFLPDDRGHRSDILRDVTATHQTMSKKHDAVQQNGDLQASKSSKNVPSSPLLHGQRELSQSQVDFFRMLDEKIAMGNSLSSLGSVR